MIVRTVGGKVDSVDPATENIPAVTLSEDEFPGFPVLRDAARLAGDELLPAAMTVRADTIVRAERPEEPIHQYPLAGLMVQVPDHSV